MMTKPMRPKQGDRRKPTHCVKFGKHDKCYDIYSEKFGWATHCVPAQLF